MKRNIRLRAAVSFSFLAAPVSFIILSGCGSDGGDAEPAQRISDAWVEDQYAVTATTCDARFGALVDLFHSTEADSYRQLTVGAGNSESSGSWPDALVFHQTFFGFLNPTESTVNWDTDQVSHARVPKGSYIDVGPEPWVWRCLNIAMQATSWAPCLVDVSGAVVNDLSVSPTQRSYELSLTPRQGCNFAACTATVSSRLTVPEERANDVACTAHAQCHTNLCKNSVCAPREPGPPAPTDDPCNPDCSFCPGG